MCHSSQRAPRQADFYYPQARQLNQHNTLFLMSNEAMPGAGGDSCERIGTVGFRCARDIVHRHHRHHRPRPREKGEVT